MNYTNRLFKDSLIGYKLLVLLLISIIVRLYILSIGTVILLVFLLYFYRCPLVYESYKDNIIVAPSYGTIQSVNIKNDKIYIAIFLGLFDVHQQYIPCNGKIIKQILDYNGQFALAYDLNKSIKNEKSINFIETKHGLVKVTQISGFLARTIVTDDLLDKAVNAGTRFGMIKFGSRVDLEIPNADKFELQVKINEKMTGGKTIIGKWK